MPGQWPTTDPLPGGVAADSNLNSDTDTVTGAGGGRDQLFDAIVRLNEILLAVDGGATIYSTGNPPPGSGGGFGYFDTAAFINLANGQSSSYSSAHGLATFPASYTIGGSADIANGARATVVIIDSAGYKNVVYNTEVGILQGDLTAAPSGEIKVSVYNASGGSLTFNVNMYIGVA